MRRWQDREVAGAIRRKGHLDEDAARAIRSAYVSPTAPTVAELAAEYQVGRITIWRVLRGQRHQVEDDLQDRIDIRAAENMLRRTQG
jgi:hypothetical protein